MTLLLISLVAVAAAFAPKAPQTTAFRALHSSIAPVDDQVSGKVGVSQPTAPASTPVARSAAAPKTTAAPAPTRPKVLSKKTSFYDEVRTALKSWIGVSKAKPVAAAATATAEAVSASPAAKTGAAPAKKPSPTGGPSKITYDEVKDALKAWTDGIIEIGKVYQEGGDYKAKAMQIIEENYAFSHTNGEGNQLLFKPTKAAEHPFRSEFDEFVSYFVGDGKYSEDQGFAITPWTKIRFDMHGVYITDSTATVSGNYWFTTLAGDEVKVEYTFQFVRVANPVDKLKIVLHHSSVPFSP